jgi:esterase/lipase superfamily enzyme
MSVIDIQKRVDAAIAEEKQTRDLERYLQAYLKLDLNTVRALLRFAIRYIRTPPILIEEIHGAAKRERISKHFAPILEEAVSYWEGGGGVVAVPGTLSRVVDQAYLTNTFVELVAATYRGATGRPLLSRNLHRSNLAMRQFLGSENVTVLDGLIDEGMSSKPVRTALRGLQDWGGTLNLATDTGRPAFVAPQATKNVLLTVAEPSIVLPSAKEERKGGFSYRVWYATNRKPKIASDPSKGFLNKPDPNKAMHYGLCHVFVPRCHKPGSSGTPWFKRWIKLQFKDDHLKLIKQEGLRDGDSFFERLSSAITSQPRELRHLLVYIHGFDNSFESAALRAAQVGFDLNVAAETVFFSWPSHANPKRYVADMNRIQKSEARMQEFLIAIAKRSKAEAVHLVAHSMGNQGLLRIAKALQTTGVKFANIILAAPDVDQDFFRDNAGVYPFIADRTTLYASPRDLALKLSSSKWLSDDPRAGLTPPVTVVPQIDTIEVTQFNLLDLGHGYWAQAKELITDIYQLMRYGAAPPRALLRSETSPPPDKSSYWVLQ